MNDAPTQGSDHELLLSIPEFEFLGLPLHVRPDEGTKFYMGGARIQGETLSRQNNTHCLFMRPGEGRLARIR